MLKFSLVLFFPEVYRPVTEYSATQGSSSFSEEHWPGMDTARILLALKQGPRSLENYIRKFLAIVKYSVYIYIYDCLLIEFFCDGINQPLRSELRREGPRSSLAQFMDYALLTVGSLFTVGIAEEECDTVSMTEMADVLERVCKMAATTPPSQVTADLRESIQVTADLRESSQVTVDRPESSKVTVDHHELSHISADLPESRHVSADSDRRVLFCVYHLPSDSCYTEPFRVSV